MCRLDNISIEVRMRPRKDRQLNPNAKVFENAENPKKRGEKDSKDSIGKSQSKKLTGIEMRKNDALKRELEAVQAKVKETQDILDGKDSFGQHDFKNWTPPSVSQETARGLKTLIRHSRRKVTAMRKLLESVPEVSAEDKSTTEKLDEGRKGGGDSKGREAQAKRCVCWLLQSLSDGEGEPPREEIYKKS